ncbi:polyprenyl synthetase family protein [Corynebacterium anserum]|uniref:Polyprenyl synthetase family protein n=1 Tax=Corynebacterium anserum TaxID=2684406 RepID=A0A7G7YMX3_9CORY|nr:polyprenyl synthetase family protein [Corynebacterium anserum]MBC2680926.1 polyprenyl synthetase family protein [Corynebacterium anserum]QNH95843.1 polyprenyl synthetase family protein [Corynebacterium anserum]
MNSPDSQWSFTAPLSAVPEAVNACLDQYFADSSKEFGSIGSEFGQAISYLKDFILLGGKRVRPMFAWAGIRAGLEGGGGSLSVPFPDATPNPKALLSAISALEFIQACALVHDDIIDKSDTRRGNPTTHRKFEEEHRQKGWLGSPEHYGISQAILTGDLALAWADDMLLDSGLGHKALHKLRAPWRAMRTEVIAGQILDVTLENTGSESVDDSLKVIEYKTASYTVARPLHIGAAMVGADPQVVDMLRRIGHDIGLVFQLRDDQLGVFGDPVVTGKPSGDDLRTGKRTALINLALHKGTESQVKKLRDALGVVHEEPEINDLRELIIATGAEETVEDYIRIHSQRAIDTLTAAGLSDAITSELVALTTKLNDRKF